MTKEEIAEMVELMVYSYEQHSKRIKEDRDCAIKDNDLIAVWFNNGYLIGLKKAMIDLKQIIEMLRCKDIDKKYIGYHWTSRKPEV